MSRGIVPLCVEDATASDIGAMHAIARSAPTPSWSREQLGEELSRAQARVRVARRDGEVVGYLVAWVLEDEVQILDVAVAPAARRRGVARRLLEDAAEAGRARGAVRVCLEVRASNAPALALYRSLGFERVGERKAYYRGAAGRPREDAVLMEWRL